MKRKSEPFFADRAEETSARTDEEALAARDAGRAEAASARADEEAFAVRDAGRAEEASASMEPEAYLVCGADRLMDDELFERVYALLCEALPEGEYGTRARQEAVFASPNARVIVREGATALLSAREFQSVRFIEHLCVARALRGKGVGGRLLDWYVKGDARPVVLEVEPPEDRAPAIARRARMEKGCSARGCQDAGQESRFFGEETLSAKRVAEKDIARRRVAFYERHGFVLCERPYLQPPYRRGAPPLGLCLMCTKALDEKSFGETRALLHSAVYGFDPPLLRADEARLDAD